MMKPYEIYKDSDVEWIGEIPNHWDVIKMKWISSVKRGASPRPIADKKYFDEDGEFAWVRIADVSASERYLTHTTERLSELGSSLSVKRYPGDFFLSIAGSVGKPIITKIKCCVHDGFVWFPELEINPEYLYYLFQSELPFIGLGKMGTQLNLNTETIGNIYIPSISNKDINSIVRYLDHKTSLIDNIIAQKEQLIEKLKEQRQAIINEAVTKGLNPNAPLKESGIEWLGKIPEHWEVVKLFHLCENIGSGTTPKSDKSIYYDGEIGWLNTGDLNDGFVQNASKSITSKALEDYSVLKLYPQNSIVIALYGATIGKLAIIGSEMTTNQACCVLNPNNKLNYKFLFYLLMASRPYLLSLSYGGGQPNISQEIIKQLKVSLPKIDEQETIIIALEKNLEDLDRVSKKTNHSIKKLKEYRQSIISEAVTGKIDIRDWKPKTA